MNIIDKLSVGYWLPSLIIAIASRARDNESKYSDIKKKEKKKKGGQTTKAKSSSAFS
jgi:hypothetical protein